MSALTLVRWLLEAWEPTTADINWAINHLGSIRDGGLWIIEDTHYVYQVNHVDKTLTLIHGRMDLTFHRIRTVLSRMGWRLLVQTDGRPTFGETLAARRTARGPY